MKYQEYSKGNNATFDFFNYHYLPLCSLNTCDDPAENSSIPGSCNKIVIRLDLGKYCFHGRSQVDAGWCTCTPLENRLMQGGALAPPWKIG